MTVAAVQPSWVSSMAQMTVENAIIDPTKFGVIGVLLVTPCASSPPIAGRAGS